MSYSDLIDEKYQKEMYPKPALDVWIQVKNSIL